MNISSLNISQQHIQPFSLALEESHHIKHDYDSARWLYVPPIYCDYRYVLGTVGENPLICVGINPSTATPNMLDPTMKSVERIAVANGFDSFIMFNVYAQRATQPDDLDPKCNAILHRENMNAFRWALSQTKSDSPSIWAAWGTLIEKRTYLASCLCDMLLLGQEFHACWYSAGPRSKKGHPHHPLYLRGDSKLGLRQVLFAKRVPVKQEVKPPVAVWLEQTVR